MKDFDNLVTDVKEIRSDMKVIAVDIAKNTVSLDKHMERTELNESRIKAVETWFLGLMTSLVLALVLYLLRSK